MKLTIFRVIILLTLGVIAFQLFQIQIVDFDLYHAKALTNTYRLLSEEAPRGIIYDRNGNILVRNTPSYAIAILPADLPDSKEQRAIIYNHLSQLTKVPVNSTDALTRNGGGGLQPPPSAGEGSGVLRP